MDDNWEYDTLRIDAGLFVVSNPSTRTKFSENPKDPSSELLSFYKENTTAKVLILPPCSKVTYDLAAQLYEHILVMDSNKNRLRIFKAIVPDAKALQINSADHLEKELSPYRQYLEHGQIRVYFPDRYRKLDASLADLLECTVLSYQKKCASLAANRSLKRWHGNTNTILNLNDDVEYLSSFPVLDAPAVIVGAGPSLDITVSTLKENSNKAYIIACDGALQTLLKNGVIPDFIVSMEDTLMSWRFFAGHETELKNVPLILNVKSNYGLTQNYPGPVLLTGSSENEKWVEPFIQDFSRLELGRCVGHMAFNFAIASKASEIIMTGFDLAFRNDSFHPKDMPVKYFEGMAVPHLCEIPGAYEETVKTDVSMKGFLEGFEWMIQSTSIPVVDATEGGALKKGTKIQSLKSVLEFNVCLLKNIPLDKKRFDSILLHSYLKDFKEDSRNSRFMALVEPFTSYLLQGASEVSEELKQDDWINAADFLLTVLNSEKTKTDNKAALVCPESVETLGALLGSDIKVLQPNDLIESLQAIDEHELGTVYTMNGEFPPDLLQLRPIKVFDIKTDENVKDWEKTLWLPNYHVLVAADVKDFWEGYLPSDISLESIENSVLETGYGMY
ncbi:MAG: DUF115 domain-containing protein [Lentisphaeraceae bacterium]|nr:DUF115 domain-containing protein [Lentisphaeraceae bacterium]